MSSNPFDPTKPGEYNDWKYHGQKYGNWGGFENTTHYQSAKPFSSPNPSRGIFDSGTQNGSTFSNAQPTSFFRPAAASSPGRYTGSGTYSGNGSSGLLGKIMGFGVLALILIGIFGSSKKDKTTTDSSSAQQAAVLSSSAEDQRWPDGAVLLHPGNWVRAHIINVESGDTLTLRSGPSMNSGVVAKIPADANDVVVFTSDWEPNGRTRWYRATWRGYRGYLGSGFIAANSN